MKEPKIDSERLGALLDGRLQGRDRAELLARLEQSDEDYEVFADAASLLAELEEEAVVAPAPVAGGAAAAPPVAVVEEGVIPLRPRGSGRMAPRPLVRWLALAAAVAAVALTPVLWSRLRAPEPADPARLVAILNEPDAGLPAGWINSRPWGTTRGLGDPLTLEARSVRLGALLVDLELAVRAREAEGTSRLAGEVVGLLQGGRDGEGVRASGLVTAVYDDIASRAGETPETLDEPLAEGRAAVMALTEAEHVRLGAWVEAARIAAVRRDAEFFRSRDTRAALDHAAELLAANEPAQAAVERIRAAVRAEGAPEWRALAGHLDEVLRAAGS